MATWKMYPDEVLKLIHHYKKFDCLWNYKSPNYKRIDLKKSAWQQLSIEFGRDVDEMKKKIKYLRSAYLSERKKVDESKKPGSSADHVHRPLLFYYKEFSFLDSIIVLRSSINSSYELVNKVEMEDDNSGDHMTVYTEEVLLPPPSPSNPITPSSPSSSTSIASYYQKPRKRPRAILDSKIDDAVDTIIDYVKSGPQETIYSAFGKTVALQLSQLTPLEATSTMDEIHRLLSKNIINSMLARNKRISSRNSTKTSLSTSVENSIGDHLHTMYDEEDI